jgi:hypothetical protein
MDPDLFDIIDEAELPHQFYVLRWFMLLMCQDVKIDEAQRLWDTLLSAEGPSLSESEQVPVKRFKFLIYVAVAMVVGEKQSIIEEGGDFSACMENL